MRRARRRIRVLLLALAAPGLFALSCSSTIAREFRDAAINGAASFVEQEVFNLLDTIFLPSEDTDG